MLKKRDMKYWLLWRLCKMCPNVTSMYPSSNAHFVLCVLNFRPHSNQINPAIGSQTLNPVTRIDKAYIHLFYRTGSSISHFTILLRGARKIVGVKTVSWYTDVKITLRDIETRTKDPLVLEIGIHLWSMGPTYLKITWIHGHFFREFRANFLATTPNLRLAKISHTDTQIKWCIWF